MKYIAKPVEVDSWPITQVSELADDGSRRIHSNDRGCIADAGMLARMTPVVGDYMVLQADGYLYLNPKDVFERKYRPDTDAGRMEAIRAAVARGWCHIKNSAKTFDPDLAEAISAEVSKLFAPAEPNALELGAMVRAAGLAGE